MCPSLLTMSTTTEVYTLEPTQQLTSSRSINTIRARSPHPPELGTISRTSDKKDGDVELATLSRVDNPSHGGSKPPSQHSNETKVPWWKPHLQFAACCSSLLLAGWNDGSTGPLLPRIQSHYHVRLLMNSVYVVVDNESGRIRCRLVDIHFQLCGENTRITLHLNSLSCFSQGFITAALANVHLTDKFGFGTVRTHESLTHLMFDSSCDR